MKELITNIGLTSALLVIIFFIMASIEHSPDYRPPFKPFYLFLLLGIMGSTATAIVSALILIWI